MIFPLKKSAPVSKKLSHKVNLAPLCSQMSNFEHKYFNVAFSSGRLYSYGGARLRNDFEKFAKLLCADSSGPYLFANGEIVLQDTGSSANMVVQASNVSAATVYNGKLFYSTKDGLIVDSSGQCVSKNHFSCLAVCGEHIVGTDGNHFYISNATDDESYEFESIDLPTPVFAISVCGKSVYLLGCVIYKAIINADLENIVLKPIADGFSDVIEKSVASYNNIVLFANDGGLFRIVNDKVKRVFESLDSFVNYRSVRGCFFNGQYHMSCRAKDSENGATFVLDIINEKILGVPLGYCEQFLSDGTTELWIKNGNDLYSFDGRTQRAVCGDYIETVGKFEEDNIDFGTDCVKSLRSFVIDTKYDVTVTIFSERVTKTVRVCGKRGKQTVKIGGTGKRFSVILNFGGMLDVSFLTINAETVGGGA